MAGEDSASLVSTCIVFSLAISSVASRFYVRVHTKVGLAWDDWWILIGLVLAIMTGSVLMWGIKLDPTAAKDISDAVRENRTSTFDTTPHTTYIKVFFISSVLYFSIVTPIKISILLLYRRIFAINASFRMQSLLVGVVVVVFGVAATLGTLLNCRPMKYRWTGLLPEQYCFNLNIYWMVMGAVEVVIDTIILVLPVRMVLGLQLSRKRKISLVLVFLFGGFVIITGILRVIYGYVPGKRILFDSGADLWQVSTVHIGMAIVCACLPTIRPLLAQTSSLIDASSSSMRRYYSDLKARSSKGDSDYDRNIMSRTEVMIESRPLKHQESHSVASLNESPLQAMEVVHLEYQNCYPGAGVKDPHIKSVWSKNGSL